eukprot:PhM_4_TR8340/c0_g1_i1/m.17915/K17916/KIF16B, SNX23; kinesin family member 16B
MSGQESVNVVVGIRVRPLNAREKADTNSVCVFAHGATRSISISHPSDDTRSKTFTFDKVYNSMDSADRDYATQEEVFRTMGAPALDHAFKGYNTCIFAYGQTGSGKTYTMMGHDDAAIESERQGMIPRVFRELFERVQSQQSATKSFRVQMSYYEIYNERPSCLLDPDSSVYYRVREHPVTGPYVENITVQQIHSTEEVLEALHRAGMHRHTAQTKMNDVSSRSHAVCTITLACSTFATDSGDVCETVSRMNLVDLAGSERSSVAGTSGLRLQEGNNINKSLLTLGNVIEALAAMSSGAAMKERYVPYRDSTLTWLLRDALGGNSRTHMLAMVSPSVVNVDESLNTLKYADRAKKITNVAVINVDSKRRIIFELRAEIARLRAGVQKYKDMQKMDMSVDDDMLRLHREEPFLMQLHPVPTTPEPVVYFIVDGITEIGSEDAPHTDQDGSSNAESNRNGLSVDGPKMISLNRRFDVVQRHVVLDRKHTNVTIRHGEGEGGIRFGEVRVDDAVLHVGETAALKSGNTVALGEYLFKYVNPFDITDMPARRSRRMAASERDVADKINASLVGVLDTTSVPGMDSLATPGENHGDKKIVRDEDGTLSLFQWSNKDARWHRVSEGDVDSCLNDILAHDRAEGQLSERIGTVLSEFVSTTTFPTPEEVMERPVRPTKPGAAAPSPVVAYDPKKSRYSVFEPHKDGTWHKASGVTAELAAISFAELKRAEQHQHRQTHNLAKLSETTASLTQAKENLTAQLDEQEHAVSERHAHLQQLQVSLQHARQKLAKKEAQLQHDQTMYEREIETLRSRNHTEVSDIESRITMIRERNRRLQENLEAKDIENSARLKIVFMVEEARDNASVNVASLKGSRERLQARLHERLAEVSQLRLTRDELNKESVERSKQLQKLHEQLRAVQSVPEGSIRAEYLRLVQLRDQIAETSRQGADNLDILSHKYTNFMMRERESLGEITDMQIIVSDLQAHQSHTQEIKDRALAEIESLEADVKRLQDQIHSIEADDKKARDVHQTTIDKARQKEHATIEAKIADRKNELQKLLQASTSAHSQELKTLQKEIQAARATAQSLADKVQVDEQRVAELSKEIEKKDKRIDGLKEDVQRVQKDTQSQMSIVSTRKDADKLLQDRERDVRAANTKLSAAEQGLRDRKLGEEKIRQTIAETKESIASLSEELATVKAQLAHAEQDAKDARQELTDAKRALLGVTATYEAMNSARGHNNNSGHISPVSQGAGSSSSSHMPRLPSFRARGNTTTSQH